MTLVTPTFAARVCVGATVVIFALLFFQQAGQLYVIDEAEYPLVAKAISEGGRPIYYRGEDMPANIGIWHPPLYTYSLAVWQQLFGTSHEATRAFGLACALVAAALGWLVLRRLFPRQVPWLGVAWLALFLLHPYAIQSALLTDIDTTVLVPTSMLALWVVVECVVARRWSPDVSALYLGVAVGVNLLGKLTTPIALVPIVVATLWLLTRSIPSTIRGLSIVLAVAATVFVSVWGGISALARVAFTYPFTFSYDSFVARTGSRTLGDRLSLLRPSESVEFWLTPLLLVMMAVGVFFAIRHIREPVGQAVLLVAVFALTVFFTYNVVTGPPFGFPKYYAPALGPMVLVAVAPLGLVLSDLALRRRLTAAAVFALCALAVVLFALAFREYRVDGATDVYPDRPWWFTGGFVLVVLAALALVLRPRQRLHRPAAWASLVVCAGLVVLAVTGFSSAAAQRSSMSSVRYFPGERDFELTVARVKELLGGRAMKDRPRLISAKDVGYESGVRYYEDGGYLASPAALAALIRSDPRMVIVTRAKYDFSSILWPDAFETIDDLADPAWVSPSGDFTIWRRTSAPTDSES